MFGVSTSHNPVGLNGLLQRWLYCFFLTEETQRKREIISAQIIHAIIRANVEIKTNVSEMLHGDLWSFTT
jgi:hypothetical protein